MANVTNVSRSTVDLIVGVKDGQAQTEGIRPGETKDVDVDTDDPRVKILVSMGVITVQQGGRKTPPQQTTASRRE
jgi:hypothetical protein